MAIRSLLPEVWSGERSVWNPVREMNRLQRRIDRLFDEVFTGGGMPSGLFRGEREFAGAMEFVPACDVAETDKHYLLTFDLPGVKKDEVSISLRDHELTISGERKMEHEEKAGGHLARERQYGSFFRSFTIPGDVKPEQVEARYENGVLQVAIPKVQEAKAKEISIKEGKLLEAKPGKAA